MSALRPWLSAQRRWLPLLAVLALLARALVPAGWMPVADARGVTLALCDGDAPMGHAAMAAMAMPMKPGAPIEHHHGAPDHPCAFAAAAATFTAPALVAPEAPTPLVHRSPPTRAAVAIGRGLAAPPPPPTGPPAFA